MKVTLLSCNAVSYLTVIVIYTASPIVLKCSLNTSPHLHSSHTQAHTHEHRLTDTQVHRLPISCKLLVIWQNNSLDIKRKEEREGGKEGRREVEGEGGT